MLRIGFGNFAVQMSIRSFKSYLSLIKFSHTIFAMPFALIGFSLGLNYASPEHPIRLLLLVILCMVFARSAAMAFNRWLDRDIDKLNPRTTTREIPSGILGERNVLIFVIINSLLFITTTWFINELCFYLSFIALFVILFYSYTKRFTWLCHIVLGIGLSLAPVGAYLAVTGEFAILPVLIGVAVLTWVSGFDIIYALQDDEFDQAEKLRSIPAAMGRRKALHLSTFLHLISFVCLLFIGVYWNFGWGYFAGFSIFSFLLAYQHMIVKPDDLSRVNLAFGTTNGIASLVFAAFVIADIFLG